MIDIAHITHTPPTHLTHHTCAYTPHTPLTHISHDSLTRTHATTHTQPTEKDKVIHDTLMRTCKRASELYLNDNIEEAMFYYKEAIDTLWTDIGVNINITL